MNTHRDFPSYLSTWAAQRAVTNLLMATGYDSIHDEYFVWERCPKGPSSYELTVCRKGESPDTLVVLVEARGGYFELKAVVEGVNVASAEVRGIIENRPPGVHRDITGNTVHLSASIPPPASPDVTLRNMLAFQDRLRCLPVIKQLSDLKADYSTAG